MTPQRDWPFVGRQSLIVEVLDRLAAGHSVILGGAAGLGKTCLAREVAATLVDQRVVVHRITASPASAHLPLAPFASLIAEAPSTDVVGVVLTALGADGRAGAGDPVLLVDDLHVLDDASAAVLQQVLLSGHVRLLGTRRAATTLPTAVTRWQQEATVAYIDVPPLSDDDIKKMVESALGGTLDRRSGDLLTDACVGNPMYARELVEGSTAAGSLLCSGGLWSFAGALAATALLEEVVLERLSPLRANERAALEILAVGGQLPHQLLQHIVGADPLERLERHQVAQVVPGTFSQPDQVAVMHPLYAELTLARLGPLARVRIYRRLAMAVDDLQVSGQKQPSGPEFIRSATWKIRGDVYIAADDLLNAARQAREIGDSPLAAELAEIAYRRGGDAKAALLASWCLAEGGRHDESIELLKDAAQQGPNPWEQAATRLRVAEELWWTARQQAAMQYLDETDLPDGPWYDLLEAQRGVFAVLAGNLPEAWLRCRPLINHPHVSVRLVAAIAVANAGTFGDAVDESLQVCEEAVAAIARVAAGDDDDEVGQLGDPNLFLAIQLVAMLHEGEVAAAAAFAEAGYAATVRQRSVQARAWTAMLCGQALGIRGELLPSCRYLIEAEHGWAGVGLMGFASWCAGGLARSQVELGLLDQAEATLSRADDYKLAGFEVNEAQLHFARAWLANAQGDRASASTILARSLDQAVEFQQWTHVAETWHEAARLDLLESIGGIERWQRPHARLAAARFDFVQAVKSPSVAGLEKVSGDFESLGALLYAAEAAALAARKATSREAVRLDGVVGRLLAGCGHAHTPLLRGRSSGPLSIREDEIARLAGQGLTNRQIAERLIVSERTVENHIYRIFIKLGVDGRHRLAEALTGILPKKD